MLTERPERDLFKTGLKTVEISSHGLSLRVPLALNCHRSDISRRDRCTIRTGLEGGWTAEGFIPWMSLYISSMTSVSNKIAS
jgi:hypothetical protein